MSQHYTTGHVLSTQSETPSWTLPVFTGPVRATWIVFVAITVLSEVVPVPLLPRLPFYAFVCAKATLFTGVGYLTPLTFWRFNALYRGIVFAATSAALVEGSQGLLRHGHAFHWYELLFKLTLLFVGFALALDARYDRQISLYVTQIKLTGEHFDGNS